MIVVASAIAALLVGAWGALCDIRSRTLPNHVCLLFAACCAVRLGLTEGWDMLGSSALHMLAVLAVGLPLFALRWLGGGDVKFYAAAALGIPWDGASRLLMWSSVAGLVLTIVMMALKLRGEGMAGARRIQIPFGVAIFAGYALAFPAW